MRRIYERHPWPTIVLALTLAATPVAAAATRAAKLNVVASTSDLAALAKEVGGNRIEVDSLVRGNEDPCEQNCVSGTTTAGHRRSTMTSRPLFRALVREPAMIHVTANGY